MNLIKHIKAGVVYSGIVAAALTLNPVASFAAPTETTKGGTTTVALAPGLLTSLTALNVRTSAVSPAKLKTQSGATTATFPITTGQIDFGTMKAEIDHAGGLAYTTATTRVTLTAFIVDATGATPVLTGLVTANGNLVGRIPLFNLNNAASTTSATPSTVTISHVAVTLTGAAATALNTAFGTSALVAGTPIGMASIKAKLVKPNDDDDEDDDD